MATPTEPLGFHWPELERHKWIAAQLSHRAPSMAKEAFLSPHAAVDFARESLLHPPAGMRIAAHVPELLLAVHGSSLLEAVLHHAARDKMVMLRPEIAMRIESPAIAARWVAREDEPALRSWVDLYPLAAAHGLIPIAFSGSARPRKLAIAALQHLAGTGHADAILCAAKAQSEDVETATTELLELDARFDCPKKPLKMPSSYRPKELRAPRLKGGKALPLWAVERLAELLRFSSVSFPYVGLEEVRNACDAESLADYAWDLAKAWDTGGGKSSQLWMLHAVAHFGDDACVRGLTPTLKGAGILELLARIGTDAALMELGTILERLNPETWQSTYARAVEDAFAAMAAQRRTSVDVLRESFVPTCGVGKDGSLRVDLGDFAYRIEFDSRLQIILRDEDGERARSWPRATVKGVNAEKLERAKALHAELAEDLAAIATQAAATLERAMLDARCWSMDDFQSTWFGHPLMFHLARATVWECVDESGEATAFRICGDRSFADVHDAVLTLGGDAFVRVAHPGRWDVAAHQQWKALFMDYELLASFPQLARVPVPQSELADAEELEAKCTEWERFLIQLRALGFRGASYRALCRALPGGIFITANRENNKATRITFRALSYGRPMPISGIPPAARSELLYLKHRASAMAD